MKHLYFLIGCLYISFCQLSAQDYTTKKSDERTVEKWIVAGSELEELLKELGIAQDVESIFNDEDKVEVIRIKKNPTQTEMFMFKGGEGMEFDFDMDELSGIQELKKFKFRLDDDDGVREFEWEGDEEMPEGLKDMMEGLHKNLDFDEMDFQGDFDILREDFIEKGEPRPLLGVYTGRDGEPSGLVIKDVINGSGAAKAGLIKGDKIISVDGQSIQSTSELIDQIQNSKIGDEINVVINRDGKQQTIKATLGQEEEREHQFMHRGPMHKSIDQCLPSKGHKPRFGLQFIRTSESAEGSLVIDQVLSQSTAEAVGLKPGDKIESFNNKKISSHKELISAIDQVDKGENFTITVDRNGQNVKLSGEMKADRKVSIERRVIRQKIIGDHDHRFESGSSDDDIIIIRKKKLTDLGLNEKDEREMRLQIYPNPTAGAIRIEFSGDELPTTIKIYDAQGKEYYNDNMTPENGRIDQTIELDDQPNGAIFLSIKNGDDLMTQKVILQK